MNSPNSFDSWFLSSSRESGPVLGGEGSDDPSFVGWGRPKMVYTVERTNRKTILDLKDRGRVCDPSSV